MEIHKKPSKTKSKTIFGPRKSLFGPFYAIPFYIGKSPITVIPGCTQTRISWAKNLIFTFCKNWWLRIKKLFHMNSTCFFDPGPPPIALRPKFGHFLAKIDSFESFLPITSKRRYESSLLFFFIFRRKSAYKVECFVLIVLF